MSSSSERVNQYLLTLFSDHTLGELVSRLSPKQTPVPCKLPKGYTLSDMDGRLCISGIDDAGKSIIADEFSRQMINAYSANVENYIGTLRIPVGLMGPLRVNGVFANGDFLVPLATTEAALVASYHRGSLAITESGGCTSMLLNEGISRSPAFVFNSLADAGVFAAWANQQMENFRNEAEKTTSHGRLISMKTTIEGNHVYLYLEFTTADASGQNMVTIAAEAVRQFILKQSPVPPVRSYVEANMSGDKKASFQSFHSVRGKKVTAEVLIPPEVVLKYFRTSAEEMARYWQICAIGGSLSGTIGLQGHYANGLAALYLACGQDGACVAESAVGLTRMEKTADGSLYASVSLPNIIVGTVGGGTGLPSQQVFLKMVKCPGKDKAKAFAELTAAVCLAGELSISAALTTGEFTRAHRVLARSRLKKHRDKEHP